MSGSRLFMVIHEADIQEAAAVLCRHPELALHSSGKDDAEDTWQTQAETLSEMRRRIDRALEFIDKHAASQGVRAPADLPADAAANEPMLQQIETGIQRFRKQRRSLEESIRRLKTMAADVRKLLELNMDVGLARSTGLLFLVLGLIPNAQWQRLSVALARTPALVLPLAIEEDQRLVAAASRRDEAAVIRRILQSIGFRELSLPEHRSGTATELLPQLEGRLKAQTERLALLHRELHREIEGGKGQWRSALTALRRKVQAELDRAERIGRHRRTGSFYSVEGYLPKRPSEQAAFDLIQEMHDRLQHPHTILMVPEEVSGAS